MGVRIHYPNPGETQIEYFWGYRNHILADLESELPLWEITQPTSVHETTLAIPLLDAPVSSFRLQFQSVSGDAEYDVEAVLKHIVHKLKSSTLHPT